MPFSRCPIAEGRGRTCGLGGGFTLVELLVVLAVIAVLAGMLLPALGRAQAKARQAACLSNLRQVGLGFALYQEDHQGRFPDRRDLKRSLGYRPWTDWPLSDPRAGWAVGVLKSALGNTAVWRCPAIRRPPLAGAVQVEQDDGSGRTGAVAKTAYWLWRFDREDEVVPLDNFWGKTSEAALADLQVAGNPVVGRPGGLSEVELMVDVYFPSTIPTVSRELAGRSAHMGGRNRLMLDLSAGFGRDARLGMGP